MQGKQVFSQLGGKPHDDNVVVNEANNGETG
jgi:hypothetical protein